MAGAVRDEPSRDTLKNRAGVGDLGIRFNYNTVVLHTEDDTELMKQYHVIKKIENIIMTVSASWRHN